MLDKKKIFFVIFSRANYSSIKSVLIEAKKNKNIKFKIIIGASAIVKKFGNLEKIIEQDGFKIDYKINNLVEGGGLGSMVKTTALGMIDLTQIFSKEKKIDLVITIGDRYETMATAISASYMNIPLAHTMGGEVTGTLDENVRHAITKLSHLHFVSNYDSYKRVIRLGENRKNVFNVGCPRIDLLKDAKNDSNFIFNQIPKIGIGDIQERIKKNEKFIILLQHPVTTEIQKTDNDIKETLLALRKIKLKKIILWPNPDAGYETISREINIYKERKLLENFRLIKNLPIKDYASLLSNTACIVGNSSSAIRDCSYIGTPAVNIGSRQNSRLKSKNVLDVKNNAKDILKAINIQLKRKKFPPSKLYGSGNAAKKIISIILKTKHINVQKKISY